MSWNHIVWYNIMFMVALSTYSEWTQARCCCCCCWLWKLDRDSGLPNVLLGRGPEGTRGDSSAPLPFPAPVWQRTLFSLIPTRTMLMLILVLMLMRVLVQVLWMDIPCVRVVDSVRVYRSQAFFQPPNCCYRYCNSNRCCGSSCMHTELNESPPSTWSRVSCRVLSIFLALLRVATRPPSRPSFFACLVTVPFRFVSFGFILFYFILIVLADPGGVLESQPAVPPPRGWQRDGRHVGVHARPAPLMWLMGWFVRHV